MKSPPSEPPIYLIVNTGEMVSEEDIEYASETKAKGNLEMAP